MRCSRLEKQLDQVFRSLVSAKNGETGLSSFPDSIRDSKALCVCVNLLK